MVEAITSLQQIPSPAQARTSEGQCGVTLAQARTMGHAVIVLARQSAIKAVKRQLQAQGLRPQLMAYREIVAAANEYLANHRDELIPQAKAIVERWKAEGVFGPRGGIRL
jgi:hypothetical protein